MRIPNDLEGALFDDISPSREREREREGGRERGEGKGERMGPGMGPSAFLKQQLIFGR